MQKIGKFLRDSASDVVSATRFVIRNRRMLARNAYLTTLEAGQKLIEKGLAAGAVLMEKLVVRDVGDEAGGTQSNLGDTFDRHVRIDRPPLGQHEHRDAINPPPMKGTPNLHAVAEPLPPIVKPKA